jgi:hypothetical protein
MHPRSALSVRVLVVMPVLRLVRAGLILFWNTGSVRMARAVTKSVT